MNGQRSDSITAAGILALGLVVATAIGGWFFVKGKRGDQTITVTGSAKERITSDLVIWRAGVSYQSSTLSDSYRALSESVPKVKTYLVNKGIPDKEITISAITSQTLHGRASDGGETSEITGYSLKQELEVRSNDVEKIAKVAREATELINQGILIDSQPPEYHYTKLGDLKIKMLAAAAKDAQERAQKIAESTNSKVGAVRNARMGVLQITPADSNEVSDSGMNDTSSLEKDITAVVNIGFAVD